VLGVVIESDERLFERLRAGDLAAFDALYARYERPLFGFLLALVGDRAEAEDLFHDAFLALLRSGDDGGFRGGSFRTWIFRVARNRALNRLRDRGRARLEEAPGEELPVELGPDTDPEGRLDARGRIAALERALGRLPPRLAEVFHLRAAGLSYEELAEALEVPIGTIKSRIHEMVELLKKRMGPWTAR
jgi:RNA polymerase sigma-70 factor (ECF subfamily)